MKQEDTELLIKDLCARLPYGVKAQICIEDSAANIFASFNDTIISVDLTNDMLNGEYSIEDVKPYLFPLSSMTGEQRREYLHLLFEAKVNTKSIASLFDWFNKNHFDYRGLIDKGLAIDATNLNIYQYEFRCNN